MSPQEFMPVLDQYALDQYGLFAIGMIVALGAVLFLWRKFRRVEVRLDDLRREVDQLNLIEERRFLLALTPRSNREPKIEEPESSDPSIVPEIADNSAERGDGILSRLLVWRNLAGRLRPTPHRKNFV